VLWKYASLKHAHFKMLDTVPFANLVTINYRYVPIINTEQMVMQNHVGLLL